MAADTTRQDVVVADTESVEMDSGEIEKEGPEKTPRFGHEENNDNEMNLLHDDADAPNQDSEPARRSDNDGRKRRPYHADTDEDYYSSEAEGSPTSEGYHTLDPSTKPTWNGRMLRTIDFACFDGFSFIGSQD
ncbi:hypothetical protein RvY_08556 [Ramazzottius varieornatus]|uniref:Uncharacterized protein n=1 Tax=Ramazzottius varieornatus TaxID=947166 RepID=A0A1D1VEB8_RAMVA|nr:hypothetical protein RvY_08556 [Ramazzottius varieornatus]